MLKPNAEYNPSREHWKGEFTVPQIRGMICNPVYAGISPYPPLVSDEEWVKAAMKMVKEDGLEQFLVNMLYVLRKAMEAYSD